MHENTLILSDMFYAYRTNRVPCNIILHIKKCIFGTLNSTTIHPDEDIGAIGPCSARYLRHYYNADVNTCRGHNWYIFNYPKMQS